MSSPAFAANSAESQGEPVSIWTGRRGAGYMAPEDALTALKTRQKTEPNLNWRVEHMPNDRYRLAGYERPDSGGASLMETGAPAFNVTQNPSGTAMVTGDEDAVRQAMAQHGITSFVRVPGGFLVGRSQAMQLA